jgi:hypothetical protein
LQLNSLMRPNLLLIWKEGEKVKGSWTIFRKIMN